MADSDLASKRRPIGMAGRAHIDIAGKATSTCEILEFARSHPHLINVKEERLPNIDGSFYSLNYTEEANSAPAADWHPITLRCRGLVIFEPQDEHPYFAIVPHPKFFNWPKHGELPDEVTFRRKVDGSCIHATVIECPQLCWIVGTRGSVRSPQAVIAETLLPTPSEVHLGLTSMMELIDPVADPHGETAAATGPPGLRLLAAWRDGLKLHFPQLDGVVSLLGSNTTLVPQEVKPRAEFVAAFGQIERALTRDEVREGWVVEDCNGELHKYKSKTWLTWSEVPMVNDRNVLKVLRPMLKMGNRCPRTAESINEHVLQQFRHLSDQRFQEFPELVASERDQLEQVMSALFARAEAMWEAGVSALAAPLEAAAGGLHCNLERKVAFKVSGAPFAKVAFETRQTLTVPEFLNAAKENRSPSDILAFMLSGQHG